MKKSTRNKLISLLLAICFFASVMPGGVLFAEENDDVVSETDAVITPSSGSNENNYQNDDTQNSKTDNDVKGSYKITFKNSAPPIGSLEGAQSVNHAEAGTYVVQLPPPTVRMKTNTKYFVGWWSDAEQGFIDLATAVVTQDDTLTAMYGDAEPEVEKHRIEFVNGDTGIGTMTGQCSFADVVMGTYIKTLSPPIITINDGNEDKYFAGWQNESGSIIDVETHQVTKSETLTAIYKSTVMQTVTITAESLTAQWTGETFTVGTAFTVAGIDTGVYTVSGITASGASRSGVGTTPNTLSGTPKIMMGSNDVTDEFNIVLQNGALTITGYAPQDGILHITLSDKSVPYGDAVPAPGSVIATVTNVDMPMLADLSSYVVAGSAPTTAGTYDNYYTLNLNALNESNYPQVDWSRITQVVVTGGNLEITRRTINITISSYTILYGDPIPVLGASLVESQNGMTWQDFIELSTTYTQGMSAGVYPITWTAKPGVNTNCNLVVEPENPTVTVMEYTPVEGEVRIMITGGTMTYGDTGLPQGWGAAETSTPANGGLKNLNDYIVADKTADLSNPGTIAADTYTLTIDEAALKAANPDYDWNNLTLVVTPGQLVVNKLTVRVVPLNQNYRYGEGSVDQTQYTLTPSTLPNGTAINVTLHVVFSSNVSEWRTLGVNSGVEVPGDHTIHARAFSENPNLEIVTGTATLTVGKYVPAGGVVINVPNVAITYGDTPSFSAAEVSVPYPNGAITIPQQAIAVAAPTGVGGYYQVAQTGESISVDLSVLAAANPMYDWAYMLANGLVTINKGTLTVLPKTVTINSHDAVKQIGQNDPANWDIDVTGAVLDGDTVNYTVARAKGEGVGIYEIRIEAGANPNYEIVGKNGYLTILAMYAPEQSPPTESDDEEPTVSRMAPVEDSNEPVAPAQTTPPENNSDGRDETLFNSELIPGAGEDNDIKTWALFDLIVALLTVLGAILMIMKSKGQKIVKLVLSVALAIAAVVTLLLTQAFTNSVMIFIDKWIILIGAFAIVQAILIGWSSKTKETSEQDAE